VVPGKIENPLPDVSSDNVLKMPPEEYCARVLARVCENAMNKARDQRALLVNYNQLPDAVTSSIVNHFGVCYTEGERARMRKVSEFNSKTPQLFFEPDTERKQTEATEAARRAAAAWVDPIYEQLEALRLEIGR